MKVANTKLKKTEEPKFRRISNWVRAHWPKLATISTLIALFTTYVNFGVDSLRSDLYQPLYREINVMDDAIQANTLEKNYSTESFENLKKNGNLLRVPKSLRNKIIQLYQLSAEEHSHILVLARLVAFRMPKYVTLIRSEQEDKDWVAKNTAELNFEMKTPVEVYGATVTMRHAARGPAISVVDTQHPFFVSPGLVTWQLNDWIQLPESANHLWWPNTWFLSFDERNDGWYYRITHDDLDRRHMSLNDFLQPMYKELLAEPEFQQILKQNTEARALMEDVKNEIAERVVHPRHLWDLVEF